MEGSAFVDSIESCVDVHSARRLNRSRRKAKGRGGGRWGGWCRQRPRKAGAINAAQCSQYTLYRLGKVGIRLIHPANSTQIELSAAGHIWKLLLHWTDLPVALHRPVPCKFIRTCRCRLVLVSTWCVVVEYCASQLNMICGNIPQLWKHQNASLQQ